jgi:hypothetical protein
VSAGEAGNGPNGPKSPYSPSQPMEEDDDLMDWSHNLIGVRTMLEQAGAGTQSEGQDPNLIPDQAARPPDAPKSINFVPPTGPTDNGQQSTTTGTGRQTLEVPVVPSNKVAQKVVAGLQTPEVQAGTSSGHEDTIRDIEERSKEYVRKAKEKKIKELEDGLGQDVLAYKVILAANRT